MIWTDRYSEPDFAYGKEPNDFVRAVADNIPDGPVLCIAEGQGRNAVYIAGLGHRVLAVDQSDVGLRRASELAAERGVTIETAVADLEQYSIQPEAWAGIVSVFGHLPPVLRRKVHKACVEGLVPGGVFILEAYSPANIGRGTGGPPSADMCMTVHSLRDELDGLEFLTLEEREREIHEGIYHRGLSMVVRVLAIKPYSRS